MQPDTARRIPPAPVPEPTPRVAVTPRPQGPVAVQSGAPDPEASCQTWRPRLRRNHSPSIPTELQAIGITSGRVVLRFRVDDDGYPDAGTARVLETTSSALVSSALEALDHLRYEPAPSDDCGAVWMERTIRFW